MKHLIIIGNGFDLAHDLKTDYLSFIKAIKENPDKYSISRAELSHNQLFQTISQSQPELWCDIEALYFDILINFDNKDYLREFYKSLTYYDNIIQLNSDFDNIKNYLCSYLMKQEQNFKPIENYQNLFELFDKKDTVILNFNYTNTVKKYLECKRIELIHIHGELYKDINPVIFGYAASNQDSKRLLQQNDNNYVRNIKKFNYLFTDNESNLKNYLNSEEFNVYILGHSCGVSDSLILSQIFNSRNIHKIIPFYYNDINGYFNTMTNIDRIIDDYSKPDKSIKSFNKLLPFPKSYKMPQRENDPNLTKYLRIFLDTQLPKEKRRNERSQLYRDMLH